jgi:hypothetical protein
MISNNHLYFIECSVTGLVKIGKTISVRKRLSQIQNGSPTEMKVYAVIRNKGHLEKEIHQRFKNLNHRGEWFLFTKELHVFIDELLHRFEIQEKFKIGDS